MSESTTKLRQPEGCAASTGSPLRVCDYGSKPEVLSGWLNADYVECPTCGARTDEFEMHTGEAEVAWNSRYPARGLFFAGGLFVVAQVQRAR